MHGPLLISLYRPFERESVAKARVEALVTTGEPAMDDLTALKGVVDKYKLLDTLITTWKTNVGVSDRALPTNAYSFNDEDPAVMLEFGLRLAGEVL